MRLDFLCLCFRATRYASHTYTSREWEKPYSFLRTVFRAGLPLASAGNPADGNTVPVLNAPRLASMKLENNKRPKLRRHEILSRQTVTDDDADTAPLPAMMPPRRGWGIFGLGCYKDGAPTTLGQRAFRHNRDSEILGRQLQYSLRLADDTRCIQNEYPFQPILKML